MPTFVRAARRRVARPRRPRPRRVAAAAATAAGAGWPRPPTPAGPDGALPAALLAELAVVLADVAWALSKKEDGDESARGEP